MGSPGILNDVLGPGRDKIEERGGNGTAGNRHVKELARHGPFQCAVAGDNIQE
jgi:hypothetical protein